MNKNDIILKISDVHEILDTLNVAADTIDLCRTKENISTYLIYGKHILKISTSALNGQTKQNRVQSLRFVPKIHSFGAFTFSDCEYHYIITDYVQGDDLWSVLQTLTDKEKYNIGKEIAQFLKELHSISDDCYDIGHYIPTVPRCGKSWKEGHLDYVMSLKNSLSEMTPALSNKETILKAFDYIYANIDSLEYQTGAKLLHNDLHPKNIIVHEGRLSGVIDWECSQFGEADFELSHLFHWCIYPEIPENNLEIILKSLIENLEDISSIPDIEKRITIYQLEHDLNQIIWSGQEQVQERVNRINGWLNGKVNVYYAFSTKQ